jgi:hypothetical protein
MIAGFLLGERNIWVEEQRERERERKRKRYCDAIKSRVCVDCHPHESDTTAMPRTIISKKLDAVLKEQNKGVHGSTQG